MPFVTSSFLLPRRGLLGVSRFLKENTRQVFLRLPDGVALGSLALMSFLKTSRVLTVAAGALAVVPTVILHTSIGPLGG